MNDLVRFAMSVEYATGKKRGRRPVFSPNKFYPYKEELQLQKATEKELELFIEEAYGVAISGEAFAFSDDLNALSNLSEDLPDSFKSEVSAIGRAIGQNVSKVIANSSEMIVGKPYYPPAAKDEIFKTWEANFQMLCKSAESDIKKDISRIVAQAKNEGWNGKQVEKAVKKELPEKYKNRAELISRTEAAKLNTQATISTYKQIGCQYYKWMSTLDERVRLTHENMNDKICSIENPDVYYEETPDGLVEHERGDDMVHLHPGEDFQCRCTMVMWDPAIDGKYDVKEKPEEEKTEEPEQRAENDPASRELEKANERLALQEKELERAKNEAKTAENELANEKSARKAAEKEAASEKSARKAAENAQKEAEEAEKAQKTRAVKAEKRAEKAEERVAKVEIEKAAAEKKNKSLEKTNEKYYDNLVAMRETASVNFVKAEFPDETWEKEKGFNISLSRIKEAEPGNEPEKLEKEKYLSEKIAKKGHSVWLIPEKKDMKKGGNRPDAVIDGEFAELKLVTGKIDKIWTRLNKASLQSKVAYIGTTKNYDVSGVISMIRGKFMKALSDNDSYKYPFRFSSFSFVDSNGEIHNIDVLKIWDSVKN